MTAATTPATLLLVDDEPSILSALRRLLRPTGHTVLTATSGAEGLALLATQEVALVVSDMRMPGMDGAQFLEQVRAQCPDTVRLLSVAGSVANLGSGEAPAGGGGGCCGGGCCG